MLGGGAAHTPEGRSERPAGASYGGRFRLSLSLVVKVGAVRSQPYARVRESRPAASRVAGKAVWGPGGFVSDPARVTPRCWTGVVPVVDRGEQRRNIHPSSSNERIVIPQLGGRVRNAQAAYHVGCRARTSGANDIAGCVLCGRCAPRRTPITHTTVNSRAQPIRRSCACAGFIGLPRGPETCARRSCAGSAHVSRSACGRIDHLELSQDFANLGFV